MEIIHCRRLYTANKLENFDWGGYYSETGISESIFMSSGK
jgi:hypothetical protein